MKATEIQILRFVKESNKIEGIYPRAPDRDIDATTAFLALDYVGLDDIIKFVDTVANGAPLRIKPGMDVYVGGHKPPAGGPGIGYSLDNLLRRTSDEDPYVTHVEYETLHPFMDGNGRSGRVLWAWQMLHQEIPPGISLGFLHQFYYQSLDHGDARRKPG